MTDNDKPITGGDAEIMRRALHAAEARCAQLQAELAECNDAYTRLLDVHKADDEWWQEETDALRTERDGFAKTCLEQRTEIERLRALIDGLECDYTHHDEDGQGERGISCIDNIGARMCRICMAKAEADNAHE